MLSILDTCINLFEASLNQKFEIIMDDLNRLGAQLKNENFSIIEPIDSHSVRIYKEETSYVYFAYFAFSLIISLFFVIISELIARKK